MSDGSSRTDSETTHRPVTADELALELAHGRVEYLAGLIIVALIDDPYRRAPNTEGWTWAQQRPFIDDLVRRKLHTDGEAASRWDQVSVAVSSAIDSLSDGATDRADHARHLTDQGTHLLNVLHLIKTELG